MKKLFITMIFIILTGNLFSQTQVELSGGVGFTGVDVEKWYGGSVQDWFTMMGEAYVAAYPLHLDKVSIGGISVNRVLYFTGNSISKIP